MKKVLLITVFGLGLGSNVLAHERHSGKRVWNCEALADPDFVVADIVSVGGRLFANVDQESGDGDERGSERVPVVESIVETSAGSTFTYTQSGPARLLNGRAGMTRKLKMVIQSPATTGRYRDAEGYLAVESGPTGVGVGEENEVTCANYRTRAIWLTPLRDRKLDITDELVDIELPAESGLPTVTWEDQSQCLGVNILTLAERGSGETRRVQLRVEADFNWDDGLNSCLIHITQPSGAKATVTLFHNIED